MTKVEMEKRIAYLEWQKARANFNYLCSKVAWKYCCETNDLLPMSQEARKTIDKMRTFYTRNIDVNDEIYKTILTSTSNKNVKMKNQNI